MNRARLARFFNEQVWNRRGIWALALYPLSLLYCGVVVLRRGLYAARLLRTWQPPVPLIVIGNLTVGGSGKTPLVIRVAQYLKERGMRVGVITRGYAGVAPNWPQFVRADSDPIHVGDEAVLIAKTTDCPVMAGPDRVRAARALLAADRCDVLLSDDGLQHLAMGRSLEVLVVDGDSRYGNGWCLPAGPLREPAGRSRHVDKIVCNGGEAQGGEMTMVLHGDAAVNLSDRGQRRTLADFREQCVHAVAGIGRPRRFFDKLTAAGIDVQPHAFPDHHPFSPRDLLFREDQPILMTDKDAVKCRAFATPAMWTVPVTAEPGPSFFQWLEQRLQHDQQQAA